VAVEVVVDLDVDLIDGVRLELGLKNVIVVWFVHNGIMIWS
jgi:hypothetical protein